MTSAHFHRAALAAYRPTCLDSQGQCRINVAICNIVEPAYLYDSGGAILHIEALCGCEPGQAGCRSREPRLKADGLEQAA